LATLYRCLCGGFRAARQFSDFSEAGIGPFCIGIASSLPLNMKAKIAINDEA